MASHDDILASLVRLGVVDHTQAMALKHLDVMAENNGELQGNVETTDMKNWWEKPSVPVTAQERAAVNAHNAAMAAQALAEQLETAPGGFEEARASSDVPCQAEADDVQLPGCSSSCVTDEAVIR